MIDEKTCKFCGEKIPDEILHNISENCESVFCENCGTEVIKERDKKTEFNNRIDDSNHTHSLIQRVYENLRNRKNPIERVLKDSDFPVRFKVDLKTVVSRLIYPHIRSLECDPTQDT